MWLRCFRPRTNPVAARDKNTDNGTILRWCWATNQGQQKHSSKTVAPRGWSQGKKRFKFTTFEPTLRGANINSFDMWLRWPGPRTNKRRDQIGTKTRLRGLSFDDAEQQTKDCGSPAQGPVAAKGWHQTGKKRFKLDIIWTYLGRANAKSFEMWPRCFGRRTDPVVATDEARQGKRRFKLRQIWT